jgi:hypothetical protein
MKNSIVRILATLSMGALVASMSLMAQIPLPLNVTIPFSFNVGSEALPAGEYTVREVTPLAIAIASADNRSVAYIVTHSAEDTAMTGRAALVFNRYGDNYFLAQIWTGSSLGDELTKSRQEREQVKSVISRSTPPAKVTIAANR